MVPESLRAEVVNSKLSPRPMAAAMIDFDGTLSLLREGWDHVMTGMMVEELKTLPATRESPEQLVKLVNDWVVKLNGQPTIDQMIALANEVKIRGGEPRSATEYKQRYLSLLMETVNKRKQQIVRDSAPATWLVPGAQEMLQTLKNRRMPMLLASGTDLDALKTEAKLLQVDEYFNQGIIGPESDTSTFTKAGACDEMLARLGLPGKSLLNIGDGFVETKLTRDRGGIAIGVAYDVNRPGEYHAWRREQLIRAGADLIVPDLTQGELLLNWILDGNIT